MEIKKYTDFILVILLILGVVWFVGCSTTGRSVQGETPVEDVADIDELLGLTDKKSEKGEKQEEETIAEDDVLRLLGVVEEEGAAVTESKDKSQLEKEVERLEAERAALNEKEKSLREKVTQQEEDIASITKERERSAVSPLERSAPNWKTASYKDRYEDARQDYLARHYQEAIQKFEVLLAENTKNSLSDNCQYWIGESYWGLGKYQQAIDAFEKVFSFIKSNKEDAAQLKLGLCYLRLNDNERAKQEFQKLIDNYPTSEYVSSARRAIAQME